MNKKRLIYDLLLKSAEAAYQSCLVGGGAKVTTNRFEFFFNPEIGDLVLETTTLGMPRRDNKYNLGKLLRIERGKTQYDDKWIIETLYDGKEYAWNNARFVRVVGTSDSFYEISNAP